MITRLFKTGSRVVVALPDELLVDLGIKEGASVNLELDYDLKRLIISPYEQPVETAEVVEVSEDFIHLVDALIHQYRPAFEALA